jgi:hypothetical protein
MSKNKCYLPLGHPTFECLICTDQVNFTSRFIVPNCNHNSFCNACIKQYLEQVLDHTEKVKCPKPGCKVKLSKIIMKSVLGAKYDELSKVPKLTQFRDVSFDAYIKHSDGKYCPVCSHFVERTGGCDHMSCICGASFCYKCGQLAHNDGLCPLQLTFTTPIVQENVTPQVPPSIFRRIQIMLFSLPLWRISCWRRRRLITT